MWFFGPYQKIMEDIKNDVYKIVDVPFMKSFNSAIGKSVDRIGIFGETVSKSLSNFFKGSLSTSDSASSWFGSDGTGSGGKTTIKHTTTPRPTTSRPYTTTATPITTRISNTWFGGDGTTTPSTYSWFGDGGTTTTVGPGTTLSSYSWFGDDETTIKPVSNMWFGSTETTSEPKAYAWFGDIKPTSAATNTLELTESKVLPPLYDGSDFFSSVGDVLGIPIDQVNFVITNILAVILGLIFRVMFPPTRVSPNKRHMIQIVLGVSVNYFCFGSQIFHMVAQSLVAYIMMFGLKKPFMLIVSMGYILGYLSACHLYRMVYDYGGYTLDITGPLMINSQKLTSLIFHVRDGLIDNSNLAPSSVKHALKAKPRLIEFLSYIFCFHSISCGPFCFYKDYIAFIDGSHFNNIPNPSKPPSPSNAVIKKILQSAFFGFVTIGVSPKWPPSLLTSPRFAEASILMKNFYMVFVCTMHRFKYYFAWNMAEAGNLSAGLGFNGYDQKGKPKWNLMSNANVRKTEFAVNMKQFLDNWNISTSLWLRYIVYDRTGQALPVFFFSAIWHGFYVGYYITFLTACMFIKAARKLRRLIQPHFQVTIVMSTLHDVTSATITSICMCYVGFPFMILKLQPSFYVYWHLFFYLHVIVILTHLFFYFVDTTKYQLKSN